MQAATRRVIGPVVLMGVVLAACGSHGPGVTVTRSDWSGVVEALDIEEPDAGLSYFILSEGTADGGYFVAGADDRFGLQSGAIWRSPDLVQWDSVGSDIAAQPGPQLIVGIAESRGHVMIGVRDVGAVETSLPSYSTQVWSSSDGGRTVVRETAPGVGLNSLLSGVTTLGDHFVTFGATSPAGTSMNVMIATRPVGGGGWSNASPGLPGMVMTMADRGGVWYAAGATCDEGDPRLGGVQNCGLGASGLFQSARAFDAEVWTSEDGRTWQSVVTDLPRPPDAADRVTSLVLGPGAAFAAVEEWSTDRSFTRLYRSTAADLSTWTEFAVHEGVCGDLVVVDGGVASVCGVVPTSPVDPWTPTQTVTIYREHLTVLGSTTIDQDSAVEQVGSLLVDGDRLLLFGRRGFGPAIGSIPIPG